MGTNFFSVVYFSRGTPSPPSGPDNSQSNGEPIGASLSLLSCTRSSPRRSQCGKRRRSTTNPHVQMCQDQFNHWKFPCPGVFVANLVRDPYIHLNIATRKWWFPLIFGGKAMFQMGKMYLLRSPVSLTSHSALFADSCIAVLDPELCCP